MLTSFCLPVLGLVIIVVYTLRNHFFHPLHKFPGPFWAAHTNLWRVYHLTTRRFPETLLRLHARYGPVVRIAPNELSFEGVGILEDVYKAGRKFIKSDFYDGFTTFHPNSFGTRDEELHAKRRRQMAHSFSLASLEQMESIFDRHIQHLLNAIDQHCGEGPFDLKELIAYYTYDVMGELIFNADFGAQKSQDPSQLPPINEHIFLGCLYGMLPSLLPYSMRVSKYLPWPWLQHLLRSRKMLRDKTGLHVSQEIHKEKQGKQEQHNILRRLIQATDPETGERLTEEQVDSEAFAFLVAGSHTTSGSLTLLFYHLLHNSSALKLLKEELLANLTLTHVGLKGPLPAYAGLEAQLPYTMACIRESLRISPVFTMPLPRTVCDPNGALINGIHVPPKTNVCMVNYVLHHNTSIWGADHDVFRPDRWLDPSKPQSVNNIAPFGAGHRSCIGRNVAMMSIVKVLASVCSRYDLEAVDSTEKLVMESVGIGEKKGPLMVRAMLKAGK